jgi:hypothetical protein
MELPGGLVRNVRICLRNRLIVYRLRDDNTLVLSQQDRERGIAPSSLINDVMPLLISLTDFTPWEYGIFTIKTNVIFDQ